MSEAYRSSGVDTEAAAKAVTLIADLAAHARRPEVAEDVGGFAGLFSIGDGKLLAAATDGVGTKLEIARITGRLGTVGIDLVAMCADDVLCTGAEPLFFLDYLAVGRVVPEDVASVGVVDEADVLGPRRVRVGDVLIGMPSSGLHANGFSLVRTIVTPDDLAVAPPGIGWSTRPLTSPVAGCSRTSRGSSLRAWALASTEERGRSPRSSKSFTGEPVPTTPTCSRPSTWGSG